MLIYWRVIPYWKSRKSLQKTSQFEQRDEEFFHTDRECCCKFDTSGIIWLNKNWLVVLTILKNNSQWEGLSHILWKKMFETTSQRIYQAETFTPFRMIHDDSPMVFWKGRKDGLAAFVGQFEDDWPSVTRMMFFEQHLFSLGFVLWATHSRWGVDMPVIWENYTGWAPPSYSISWFITPSKYSYKKL